MYTVTYRTLTGSFVTWHFDTRWSRCAYIAQNVRFLTDWSVN